MKIFLLWFTFLLQNYIMHLLNIQHLCSTDVLYPFSFTLKLIYICITFRCCIDIIMINTVNQWAGLILYASTLICQVFTELKISQTAFKMSFQKKIIIHHWINVHILVLSLCPKIIQNKNDWKLEVLPPQSKRSAENKKKRTGGEVYSYTTTSGWSVSSVD